MNRARLAIALAVVALFAVTSGVILLANQNHRGRNLTFNVAVTDGKSMSVAPCFPATCTSDTLSATQNDNVTINITSDTTGEVHLHVYDVAFNAIAGQTVSHTFKAVTTCDCIIEWESTGTTLGALLVNP
ncbi:MAG TPA: hypothetical protein VKF16_10800 [Candidatus Dormibacteraeota bacterium]|nr:hypothetical protein [Candidatus Dormibacteraeota bacterium]